MLNRSKATTTILNQLIQRCCCLSTTAQWITTTTSTKAAAAAGRQQQKHLIRRSLPSLSIIEYQRLLSSNQQQKRREYHYWHGHTPPPPPPPLPPRRSKYVSGAILTLAFSGSCIWWWTWQHNRKYDKVWKSCSELLFPIVSAFVDDRNNQNIENIVNNNKNKKIDGGGKGGGTRPLYSHMNFIADIVENVSNSVVYLENSVRHPFFNQIHVVNSGSGFLVDKQDGVILTNAHVVANTQQIKVRFANGKQVNGWIEFIDDHIDLATVRLDPQVIPPNVECIPLGDSKRSRAGEFVIAVGAPFMLSNTVTVGVISSNARAGTELGIRQRQPVHYIQTDASINVGNSGGPLLNLDGEAIGINTLKVGEGISFAIPSEYAEIFLREAKKARHKSSSSSWWSGGSSQQQHPSTSPFDDHQQQPMPTRKKYLGLTMITLTPSLIENTRSSDRDFPDVKRGVLVYRVVLGSPAHLGGLQPGDVIQSINGEEIHRVDDVYRVMNLANELKILVRRRNEEIFLTIEPQNID